MLYKSLIFHCIILFFGITNFILFNLRVDSFALPETEVLVSFCAAFYYNISLLGIFTHGLIIDFFHGIQIGITSLALIVTFLIIATIQKKFKLLDYCHSYIICLIYLILFTSFKLFLIAIYNHININYQILIFKIINSSLFYFPIKKILQYIFSNLALSDIK
ncbi:putative membrane protein [Orientia chuto str. Dubai]|uniref:Putative membrane protein n=1 Tax=Orientia chuto str. Dubai TaxID=1359168 RepID=A0A0F3MKZ9_9RICK|nr:hypothetical protein [Candidatus Orientia mediorientalis]KJV56463.1 putative membrane protein [Orientia chuto str. Dubai]